MSEAPSGIFLGSEIAQGDTDAMFHVIPVPLEKSVSYGSGAGLGPQAIIEASDQLETFDQIHGEPCFLGIRTEAPVDCTSEAAEVMAAIRARTRAVAENRKLPFVLGGEHTVSYGAVMGVADAYADAEIGIVHFDAHGDLRESYEGSIWSHASVIKRLVDEGLKIFQLGIRNISMEELAVRAARPEQIQYLDAVDICRPTHQHQVTLPANFPQKIYITVDIDGLDAAVMPATGTPVPGGLTFWQLIDLLECAVQGREVVGMDLVEYAPIPHLQAYDYTAADIAYKMMGIARQAQLQQK